MENEELESLNYGECKSFQNVDVEAKDGTVLNVHIGAKFVEMLGLRPWLGDPIVFMEVVEEPVVTKYDDGYFISWKARNRKTGEMVSYGVHTANRHYGPRIYTMISEKVQCYLKITRGHRKEHRKYLKQQGVLRAWQVLKLERRPNPSLT